MSRYRTLPCATSSLKYLFAVELANLPKLTHEVHCWLPWNFIRVMFEGAKFKEGVGEGNTMEAEGDATKDALESGTTEFDGVACILLSKATTAPKSRRTVTAAKKYSLIKAPVISMFSMVFTCSSNA